MWGSHDLNSYSTGTVSGRGLRCVCVGGSHDLNSYSIGTVYGRGLRCVGGS